MLITLTVVIILLCVCISKHPIVHLNIAYNFYLKKRFKISDLSFYFSKLEKQTN